MGDRRGLATDVFAGDTGFNDHDKSYLKVGVWIEHTVH